MSVAALAKTPRKSNPTSARSASGAKVRFECSYCHLKDLCLPFGLASPGFERPDNPWFTRRKIAAGETLYREGDHFHFIYAVRTGTFKSSLLMADGYEQVSALHIEGEVMGLDGAAADKHASRATALEDAEVCVVSYAQLSQLVHQSSDLQSFVMQLMAREIVRSHDLRMLLGTMKAEARLAAFFLNLSQRMKVRGHLSTEVHLRMTRAELGSYLGMRIETVSRAITVMQQKHLLEVDQRDPKRIRIPDLESLTRNAGMRMQ